MPVPIPEPVPVPPPVGALVRITAFALPALGNAAPYSSNGSSKHTNMASDGKRIYVSGGDWTHSATDGTWSMDLGTGEWRQDHAGPVYPSIPAPHALQDGAGFELHGQRFVLWPGGYYPYEASGSPIREWAHGLWRYDPATNVYEQDVRLFSAQYASTGCLFGGVYDAPHIVAFGDSGGGFSVRRWDTVAGIRLPDLPLPIKCDPSYPAAYFARGKPTKIGRWVYVIGYRTDGATKQPMMFRWNLDTHATEELAAPPVSGALMRDLEIRPGTSHGKLVWPFTNGPEGDVRGIHVYDPATNVWTTDNQVPSYGNFICSAVCSLPDGRIAMSGGVFGKQQTHMWLIEAL